MKETFTDTTCNEAAYAMIQSNGIKLCLTHWTEKLADNPFNWIHMTGRCQQIVDKPTLHPYSVRFNRRKGMMKKTKVSSVTSRLLSGRH
jgi:hypothetical protein